MQLEFASSFMEAAVFSTVVPLAIYISLIVWYFLSSRRLRGSGDAVAAGGMTQAKSDNQEKSA